MEIVAFALIAVWVAVASLVALALTVVLGVDWPVSVVAVVTALGIWVPLDWLRPQDGVEPRLLAQIAWIGGSIAVAAAFGSWLPPVVTIGAAFVTVVALAAGVRRRREVAMGEATARLWAEQAANHPDLPEMLQAAGWRPDRYDAYGAYLEIWEQYKAARRAKGLPIWSSRRAGRSADPGSPEGDRPPPPSPSDDRIVRFEQAVGAYQGRWWAPESALPCSKTVLWDLLMAARASVPRRAEAYDRLTGLAIDLTHFIPDADLDAATPFLTADGSAITARPQPDEETDRERGRLVWILRGHREERERVARTARVMVHWGPIGDARWEHASDLRY